MQGPVSWMGQARDWVCAAVGIDVREVGGGGAAAVWFADWIDRQLPGLEAAALERVGWPVRGDLFVDGGSRGAFLFVSPGGGLPWRAWALDRSEAREGDGVLAGHGRVDALLRCAPASSLEADGLLVDWSAERAFVDGEPLDLTGLQFGLLSHLARHPGILFSRRRAARGRVERLRA